MRKNIYKVISLAMITSMCFTTVNEINISNAFAYEASSENATVKLNGILYSYDTDSNGATIEKVDNINGVVTIPDKIKVVDKEYSVTKINDNAFKDCTSITKIIIGNYINIINNNAFINCSSLEQFEVSKDNNIFSVIDGCLMNKQTLIKVPANYKKQEFIVPKQAINIESNCFDGCKNFNKIIINDVVVDINEYAFSNCKSKYDFIVNGGVTSISENAFMNSSGINNLVVNGKITGIDQLAFSGSSIKSISCDGNITSIDENSFKDCNSLEKIKINGGVTQIEDSAFDNCNKLSELIVNKNVDYRIKYNEENIFSNCNNLKYKMVCYSGTNNWYGSDVNIVPLGKYIEVSLDKTNYYDSVTITSDISSNKSFYLKDSSQSIVEVNKEYKFDTVMPKYEVKIMDGNEEYISGTTTKNSLDINIAPIESGISGVKYYYSTDFGSTWSEIINNHIYIDYNCNETFKFKAVSNAGNVNAPVFDSYKIVVDKPEKSDMIIDTNGYVLGKYTKDDVKIKVSGGIADTTKIKEYQYSYDNVNWSIMPQKNGDINNEITINKTMANKPMYVRVISTDNDVINSTVVNNICIDKVTPSITVKGDITTKANTVELDIQSICGPSGKKLTMIVDNKSTEIKDGKITISKNNTYTFKVSNGLGVIAQKTVVINNIVNAKITKLYTSVSSPQPTNVKITINTVATGGNLRYCYIVYDTTGKMLAYTSYKKDAKSIVWTPKTANTYIIKVKVRDDSGYTVSKSLKYEIRNPKELKLNSFTSNVVSPSVIGKAINFSCAADGENIKYNFIVIKQSKLVTQTNYLSKNTFTWIPTESGTYEVKVKVKDIYGKTISKSFRYVIR